MTDQAGVALSYHDRTKHGLERYAKGPETLDWDSQPNPFRCFGSQTVTPLTRQFDLPPLAFAALGTPGAVPPQPLDALGVSAALRFSMGISAWKELGPDRWSLRCAPSSGALYPTETYVIAGNVPGLPDGLHHYLPRDHALELRSTLPPSDTTPSLWIGLSSVHWREAWKYGERAFRYCQLDVGHALAALVYASALVGWSARMVDVDNATMSRLLGLDRPQDFDGVEAEEPDLLLEIRPQSTFVGPARAPDVPAALNWQGKANRLDPHPMYRWPIIDEVAAATRKTHGMPTEIASDPGPAFPSSVTRSAAEIILGRRSAQRFDRTHTMPMVDFLRMMDALLARPGAPWESWDLAPRVHLVVFVHQVEGMDPGVYLLVRRDQATQALRAALPEGFLWKTPDALPLRLPLYQLAVADCRRSLRTLSCHQAIAADGCFTLGMIAEVDDIVAEDPWRYRQLYWEAGMIGQCLYLEAEAAGLRGTGIGCYFDEAVHEIIGLKPSGFRSLYHFTVGLPVVDARISTLPAYPDSPSYSS